MKSNYFFGCDSLGNRINVAIRKDGTLFWRTYKFNGYGMGWSKWDKINDQELDVTTDSKGNETAKWGFEELKGYFNKSIRLPND